MKKLSVLLLLSTLGSYGWAQDTESLLLGTWHPVSVDGKEFSKDEKNNTIEFKKGGSCSANEPGKKISFCKWQVNKDGTRLIMTIEKNEMNVYVKIEGKTMTWTNPDNEKQKLVLNKL